MKVLMTGATGFVGRQILKVLVERGFFVKVLIREPSRLDSNQNLKNVEICVINDVFNTPPEQLNQLVSGFNLMIHAAWNVEPKSYLTSSKNIDSLKGTLDLARAFFDSGGQKFVGIGTCAEYDLTSNDIDTCTPLMPKSLYAACKLSVFQVISEISRLLDKDFVWCRLFYLFGEGEQQHRLVPYIRRQLEAGEEVLLSQGDQIRDFLNVRTAAESIVKVALGRKSGVENICSGVGITVRDLAESIADEYGRRDLLRFGARPDNLFDPPRIVGINKCN